MLSATPKTRGTAFAVGRTSRVLIALLREINLPPIRPLNKLSNGVSQMQIDVGLAVSEMNRRMQQSAKARAALKSL